MQNAKGMPLTECFSVWKTSSNQDHRENTNPRFHVCKFSLRIYHTNSNPAVCPTCMTSHDVVLPRIMLIKISKTCGLKILRFYLLNVV